MPKSKSHRVRKYLVTPYQQQALEALKPPDDLTVSQWAERYRILDAKSSAMPGQWRNAVTPYLVGIMDEFNRYETEEIVFVKPTQVGGTEAMQNMLGYIVQQDPAPTMIVYPTDKLGSSTSENRLQPMFSASPELADRFHARESQKDELQFDGMYISIAGSNSPTDLSSRPVKNIFMDEIDKYPFAGKKEADPISLARERTKTFRDHKIYLCSTPTLRTGHIWRLKEASDVEKHYFLPCPHCGEYIELKFSQIRWPGKDTGLSHADRAAQAVYICQSCGSALNDVDKASMLQKGEWRAVRESTQLPTKVAFWISTLYSPFTSFAQIAAEFMASKDDPDKLHNFSNSWLAEPWEDTKLKTSADLVLDRQTELTAYVVPEWAKLLTAGVDVQENCLYYTIRAYGDYITSQNIAHGQLHSWSELEELMDLQYETESGNKMVVALCLIDSGDQTDEVYAFCADHSEWALPVKGTADQLGYYKISTVNRTTSKAYGMQLVLCDGGKYKDMIASRMRLENGKKSWMVYKDCDREYAEQVTSEHKVTDRDSQGREKSVWRKKTNKADNHFLDCEVYSLCAADMLNVRTMHLQNLRDSTPQQTQPAKPAMPEDTWLQAGGDWLKQNENWV